MPGELVERAARSALAIGSSLRFHRPWAGARMAVTLRHAGGERLGVLDRHGRALRGEGRHGTLGPHPFSAMLPPAT